jgi:hypothetical protein
MEKGIDPIVYIEMQRQEIQKVIDKHLRPDATAGRGPNVENVENAMEKAAVSLDQDEQNDAPKLSRFKAARLGRLK